MSGKPVCAACGLDIGDPLGCTCRPQWNPNQRTEIRQHAKAESQHAKLGSIKAIETRYKGYRFRSRLEARWAVFFDALRIEWEYESQGYTVDGTPYLPDFWLPKFCPRYNAGGIFDSGMFAEVKPIGGDFSLARRFAKSSSHGIWLCEGVPDFRAYLVCGRDEEAYCESPAIPNADQAEGENRMYWQPGYEREDLSIPENCIGMLGFTFTNAVEAARSARFEHGESPR